MNKKNAAALTLIILGISAGPAIAGGEGGMGHGQTDQTYEYPVLSLAEAEDLKFLREEEKLARDVYLTLYKKWGLTVFNNISGAEQQHMDAVKELLDTYRIEDPALAAVGQFTNAQLQTAFDQLVARGNKSLMEALHVGGYIEELDIRDLQRIRDNTNREDILTVYDNLMRGSRNHLRAFVSQIESRGVTYEAQVLTQDEVNDIVDSPMERGK